MSFKIRKIIARRKTKKAVAKVVSKMRETKASCTVLFMTLFR